MASLLLSSLLAAVAGIGPPAPARADGAGKHGLALSVSVNSRPGLGALRPGIRVGDPVVKKTVQRLFGAAGHFCFHALGLPPGIRSGRRGA
ncbi:hypothetical protein [Streptomyces sp. LN549]|uniref:hypothetical protein n=1 Tax=Streptomyces sp. LN549 TaxID=3112979 RepID=UPI003717222D